MLRTQGNPDEVVLGQEEEEAADALVLQEVTAEATGQKAGLSQALGEIENVSKMLSDSKTEAGPEAETMTSRPANLRVVESFNPEFEERSKAKHDAPRTAPTRKKTRSQASQTSQSLPVDLIEVSRKKHKSNKRSTASKKLNPSPKEMKTNVDGQQSDQKVLSKILEELKSSPPLEAAKFPTPAIREPIVPEIPVVLELAVSKVVHPRPLRVTRALGIPMPRQRKMVATGSSSFITVADIATGAAASGGVGVIPSPLASLPAVGSLHELVREFRQNRTKLRSPRHLSEPQHFQDQHRIFREWMQKDFSAFFRLKVLQDAEKALTELYQF
ncbi:hypothetical protein D8674_030449 [Pyrus ussuriensis x Pyrus communis]|uniref:Uncharacterized protein n=1 Tax=Pyrus ussuriensis x Pyrus communis TaxID=2448454 RepID=A0A5N5EVI4_9ROSA|nr:hypothetical protein D8674_030449 [Pyrus ussuriensis x Pyrus communis]